MHPWVTFDLFDAQSLLHVPVEHTSYQVNAVVIEGDIWDAQGVVQDFVDTVEGILLVHDRVEEDAEGPYVLLFAAVRLALEDFRGCVICEERVMSVDVW